MKAFILKRLAIVLLLILYFLIKIFSISFSSYIYSGPLSDNYILVINDDNCNIDLYYIEEEKYPSGNPIYIKTLQQKNSTIIYFSNNTKYYLIIPNVCSNNPKIHIQSFNSSAVGISSLQNVITKAIFGNFTIYNIDGYSSNNKGISLQLNSYLYVDNEIYWVQNVLVLYPKNNRYFVINNIWNFTSYYSSNKGLLAVKSDYLNLDGNGEVYIDLVEGYWYAYPTNINSYSLPLNGSLIMMISNTHPVVLSFGYVIGNSIVWYDNVTFVNKYTDNAYFLNGIYKNHVLNTELVFAGNGDRSIAYLNNTRAILKIFYYDGDLKSFENLYNISISTGEFAVNLFSKIDKNYAIVSSELNSKVQKIRLYNTNIGNITIEFLNESINLSEYYREIIEFEDKILLLRGFFVNGLFYNSTIIQLPNDEYIEIYPYYEEYYLLKIYSIFPIEIEFQDINGNQKIYNITNISIFAKKGSIINIKIIEPEKYSEDKKILFKSKNSQYKFYVNKSEKINIPYDTYYLVTITSYFPIIINYNNITLYSENLTTNIYVKDKETLYITIVNKTVRLNNIIYEYNGKDNLKLYIQEPNNITISNFTRYFLVNITSKYKINIIINNNSYFVDSFSNFLEENTTIIIKKKTFFNFLAFYDIEEQKIYLDHPIKINIQPKINIIYTSIYYIAIILILFYILHTFI